MNNNWIGVALDGTLAFYDHWRGEDHIGPPIACMLERVKGWLAEGKTVKVFTARATSPSSIPFIKVWCKQHVGRELDVTNVKDFGCERIYDDRAVQIAYNTGVEVTRVTLDETTTAKPPRAGGLRLTDLFERIFIVNLPNRTDRRQALAEHLDALDLVDWDRVVWFKAFSGQAFPPPAWWGAGANAWGCFCSHRTILENAYRGGLQNCLILEDDVGFHPKAAEMLVGLAEMLRSCGAWGQCYLGGQHRGQVTDEKTYLKGGSINRTHAIAYHRQFIPKILSHIQHFADYLEYDSGSVTLKPRGWHIDHQLETAHRRGDWPVISPVQWLACQAASQSDIDGKDHQEARWWWWDPTRLPWGDPNPPVPVKKKRGKKTDGK